MFQADDITYSLCESENFNIGIDWTSDLLEASELECREYIAQVLQDLTIELNQYHGRQWTESQYKRLLGNWLLDFVHASYARWIEIEAADLDVLAKNLSIDAQFVPPVTLSEGLISAVTAPYQKKLFQQIYSLRTGGMVEPKLPNLITSKTKLKRSTTFSGFIKKAFFGLLNLVNRNNKVCVMVQPGFKTEKKNKEFIILLKLSDKFAFDDFDYKYSFQGHFDNKWRTRGYSEITNKQLEFKKIISILARLHIPAEFLEIAPTIENSINKKLDKVPVIYFTSMSHASNIFFKHFIAKENTRVKLAVQKHGAGGEIKKVNPSNDYENSIADFYFHFGSYLPGEKAIYSSPYFNIPNNEKQEREGILLTMLANPKYLYRFLNNPVGSRFARNLDDSINFLRELDFGDKAFVRFPNKDYDWNVEQIFSESGLKFSTSPSAINFRKEICKYKLNVFNYLGTTWTESMALDLPTVVFFDSEVYSFKEEFLPLISSLERVGILFNSSDKAAIHVKEVYESVDEWWAREDVQDARNEFLEKFCKYSNTWMSDLKENLIYCTSSEFG